MAKGTDVLDILTGKMMPLIRGYVPVVNNPTNVPIHQALEYENEFFEKHPVYGEKPEYCGFQFLMKKVNMVFFSLIVGSYGED